MRYLQYLRYLPFVIQLISLIKEAERDFPDHGTGPQKLDFVVTRFGTLIDISEQSGIISAQLAQKLRDGAEAIINLIVGVMKDAGGIEPAPPAPPATGDVYTVTYDTKPADGLFASGDRVYVSDSGKWRAERASDPELGAGGWRLDHTVA